MKVYPLPHYDDIDPSNNVKTLQKLVFWIFATIYHKPEWILLVV